jgi:hypothetical protein
MGDKIITPEDKANQLLYKYESSIGLLNGNAKILAKVCAITAVEEIIEVVKVTDRNTNPVVTLMYSKDEWSFTTYWEKVKQILINK